MCGICGFIGPGDGALLRRMNATLVHRGPDGDGYYEREQVHLAMRRLAIVDLTTGDQPLTNEDQRIWVVFNGEIYNHRELRRSLLARGTPLSHRSQRHRDHRPRIRRVWRSLAGVGRN